MSDMKCPICNKPMKQATYDYDKKDNDDTLYMSIMPCDCVCNFAASKAVWQELDRWKQSAEDHQNWLRLAEKRLERTRKALDVAVGALIDTNNYLYGDYRKTKWDLHKTIRQAREQITALEQKDK